MCVSLILFFRCFERSPCFLIIMACQKKSTTGKTLFHYFRQYESVGPDKYGNEMLRTFLWNPNSESSDFVISVFLSSSYQWYVFKIFLLSGLCVQEQFVVSVGSIRESRSSHDDGGGLRLQWGRGLAL